MTTDPNRPASHLEDAQKLTADGVVFLFEIQLKTESVTLYLCDVPNVTWQGNEYEQTGIQLTGEKQSADTEEARPKLQVVNPEGLLNPLVRQKLLDRATVIRKRVLRDHIDQDLPIYQQRMWYVSQVSDVTAGQSVTMELRSMSEGPNSMIPARQFMPPDFPMVSLQ